MTDSTIDNRWLTPTRWLPDSPGTYELITKELGAAYEYPDYPYDPQDKIGSGRVADLYDLNPRASKASLGRIWTNDRDSFGFDSAYPEKEERDPLMQTLIILKMRLMNHEQVPVSKAFDTIVSEFGRGSLKVSDLSKLGG